MQGQGAIVSAQPKPRATVCKKCGAPRDLGLPYAMCRDCYNEYQISFSSQYRRKNGVPERRPSNNLSRQNALSDLRRAYARLGLSVGNVWKLVPR